MQVLSSNLERAPKPKGRAQLLSLPGALQLGLRHPGDAAAYAKGRTWSNNIYNVHREKEKKLLLLGKAILHIVILTQGYSRA